MGLRGVYEWWLMEHGGVVRADEGLLGNLKALSGGGRYLKG